MQLDDSKLIHTDDVPIINVRKDERILSSGISKGNQIKWYSNNRFIKLNTWEWYEDISEVLVSYLLSFTSINNYVKYYCCKIYEDGLYKGIGCYSENFLKPFESDISFYKLGKRIGLDLSIASFDEVREELFSITGLDVKEYMGNCLCLDAITFNEDRHFGNFSIIQSKGDYKIAPIYDNGLSCLSDVFSYPFNTKLEDNLASVYSKPFSTDFISQIKDNRVEPIKIYVDLFLNSVFMETKEEKRAFNVIREGLKRTEGIAWVKY